MALPAIWFLLTECEKSLLNEVNKGPTTKRKMDKDITEVTMNLALVDTIIISVFGD